MKYTLAYLKKQEYIFKTKMEMLRIYREKGLSFRNWLDWETRFDKRLPEYASWKESYDKMFDSAKKLYE